ncbi:MAG: ABC transporter permease [Tepidisphaeraceae bacterium]
MVGYTKYLANGFVQYGREVLRSRRLIYELTRREFRSRYLGSAFGLTWAFIHPAVMMLIYWVVFRFALKSAGPVDGVPFVVWLLTGLVPWFFAAESIGAGSSIIIDNRFLVKKVVFRVSLLPVVRIFSMLPVHLFFVLGVSVVLLAYGYYPNLQSLQVFYYLAAMMCLSLGFSLLMSALVPFLKDLSQVLQVLVQILFWLTPLVWPESNLPGKNRWMLELNPLNYIVRGYRESLARHVWIWQHPLASAYYWSVTAMFLVVGGIVFLRLQSHFADML